MTHVMLGLFNLGGAELVLILILLSILLIVPATVVGIVFLVMRLTRKTANPAPSSGPPPAKYCNSVLDKPDA